MLFTHTKWLANYRCFLFHCRFMTIWQIATCTSFICIVGLTVVCLLVLTSCSGSPLQEDPRQGKYARLIDGNYEAAVKALDQELTKDPNSLQARYARATVEVESGNLNNGTEMFNKLLEDYPSYSFGYSQRSRAHFKAGKYDQGLMDVNLAIRYRPDV